MPNILDCSRICVLRIRPQNLIILFPLDGVMLNKKVKITILSGVVSALLLHRRALINR